MAKMVTRTVITTVCRVLGMNPTTEEVYTLSCVIAGSPKNEDKMLKEVHKKMDSEVFTVVKITGVEVKEELRAMDEDFFIENSKVIPGRKTNKGE